MIPTGTDPYHTTLNILQSIRTNLLSDVRIENSECLAPLGIERPNPRE